ncbi:MAG: lamin tail domain-containing protein [Christensenellaceae bacterium]|nr:lamin tail domain-containing protein [Christensenellaceae bacterium]
MKRRKLVSAFFISIALLIALIVYLTKLEGSAGNSAPASSLIINEVMTSNKGSVVDPLGNYPDWVELYNAADTAADISGYGLSDSVLKGVKYVFPSGTKVSAGGYIVVYCSGEAETGLHAPFRLSATDNLTLFDAQGQALESLALRAVASGHTLSRAADGTWDESAPSPGYPNTPEGIAAFEAGQHDTEALGVYINEFMASNATTLADKNGEYSDWIELYNANAAEVDLSGFGISDTLNQPVKYKLPEGITIPGNGCLLIRCSGNEGLIDGELHAPFSLRAYAEDVVLASRDGKILDSYSYTRQQADVSMARIPDGTGAFAPCAKATPGFVNTDAGYAAFAQSEQTALGDVYISEMLGSNQASLKAADGNYYDWVELHNAGAQAVSLAGYGLSNNPKNPAKWVFPDITLAPDEYLVLYASGLNKADAQKKNNLHLNFNIGAGGENLFLFAPDGKLLDKLGAGAFQSDVSYGRSGEGSRYYYTSPTPGAANGKGYAGITAQPQFLTPPGVYEAPVMVELSAGGEETIYYTLDCTTPTAGSQAYTGPIPVSKNTVVRAVALKEGYLTGYTSSGTFLFKGDGANHALPIATLVTDPANLWDGKTGIYAYGENFDDSIAGITPMLEQALYYKSKFAAADSREWERPASFSVFGEDGKAAFSQNVDIRIGGSYGRSRAQKAFNITARSEYGGSRMQYSFFDSRPYDEYKALVLRAGAQDQNYSKIRDELATGLLEGTDVHLLYQAYKPYVLYLNGEYWGVYFLKEKRNRFFVAQHEGTQNLEDMDIVKSSTRVSYGTVTEWNALMSYVAAHNVSDPNSEAYRYLESQIDMDSFIDYMICEIYVGQTDVWNIQYYKLPGGKWKWVFYDFCWSFGTSGVDHNTLELRRNTTKPMSDLFNALLANSQWRDAFLRRFGQLLDEAYAPARVNALADTLYAAVEPEIAREREKFNGDTFMGKRQIAEVKGDYAKFQAQIELIHRFANERPGVLKKQLKAAFGLSDSYMQEVFGG